jgi:hypothetical protein
MTRRKTRAKKEEKATDSGRQGKNERNGNAGEKGVTVSARKLAANRQNALRSTGPRTPRGKTFSRRNALRHGLFVSRITDFEALGENPDEYDDLLNGLWEHYQPVGRAEEIEVERIAVCCWRLKRVWRYENAVNLAARRDFVNRELKEQYEYCDERDKEEEAVILQLQTAKKEIAETGEVSPELKQRIFALMPDIEKTWLALDKAAPEWVKERDVSKMFQKASPQMRSWILAMYPVVDLIAVLQYLGKRRSINVREVAVGQQAIPNSEALEKILRYETTIERQLSRSVDRLERLQRRRRGEMIPPPVNLNLTR